MNIKNIDVVYSLPKSYSKKELTRFSDDNVISLRQVDGCSGNHNSDTSNDLLLIGSGYDYKLISYIADFKSKAKKIQIFGFPSFHPDMYQENLMRAYLSEDAIGGREFITNYFAPAHDPFVTASVLQSTISSINKKNQITNLYLSPLSSKPQTLGFTLYYLFECVNEPVSIIYPFCKTHERSSTIGVSKIWKYSIEFPLIT